jgi:hypothetical protein
VVGSSEFVASYDVEALASAFRKIAGLCDGADKRDGVGFSKADARYGTLLAILPNAKWTEVVAYEAWNMLSKYQNQLSTLGILYDDIPTPKRPKSFSSGSIHDVVSKSLETPRNHVTTNGIIFAIRCEYDEQLIEEVRKIPNVEWNQQASMWIAPLESRTEVAKLVSAYGFSASEELNDMNQNKEIQQQERTISLSKSGRLMFSFPYEPEIVADIKNVTGRLWDNKKKVWTTPPVFQAVEIADKYGFSMLDSLRKALLTSAKKEAELLEKSASTDADVSVPTLNGTLMPYQRAGVAYASTVGRCLIADQMGLGKLQAVSSPVLTPNGWVKMGDVKPGMFVTGKNGKPTKVTAVYPQGVKPLYRVKFSDGSSTLAGEEHLWSVRTAHHAWSNNDWITVSTGQMIREEKLIRKNSNGRFYELSLALKAKNGNRRLQIPLVEPVHYENENDELPIDPYLLGCWLGDGTSRRGQITSMDDEIHNAFGSDYKQGRAVRPDNSRATTTTYLGLESELRKLGVLHNKHIPEIYLRSNPDARLALIQGLMDTDGHAGNYSTEFSASNKLLVDGIVDLVQSLGGIARIRTRIPQFVYNGEKKYGKISYRVNIKLPNNVNPFRLRRKIESYKAPSKYTPARYIESIEYSHDEDAQCIAVEAADHLYVTDSYIVTHNTVEAIATLEARDAFPAVIVCPASLKENWKREINKWLPHRKVNIVSGKTDIVACDVNVVNYDILYKFVEPIKHLKINGLVLDESHYVKTGTSKRTKAAKDIATSVPSSGSVLLLSGTPIMNRPAELVSQLEIMGMMSRFGGKWSFLKRYTAAHHNGFGWDTSGASNLTELNTKLRQNCYIRRTKDEVLPELPEKSRNIVHLEATGAGAKEYRAAEDDLVLFLRSNGYKTKDSGEHMARTQVLKRLAAWAKMNAVEEWIDSFLASCDRKLVVFAHNVDVVDHLASKYGNYRVSGRDSMGERQAAVDAFQNDPKARVIVLNLQAGGVGITLTAGSDVVFVQMGWTPGEHDQAEDRCHRIGQKNNVQIWYLLASGTIDEDIYDLVDAKREIVDAVTEGDEVEQQSVVKDLMKRLIQKKE